MNGVPFLLLHPDADFPKDSFTGHIDRPCYYPRYWIPHFCGMTYKTDAINIAFMDGRGKKWMGEERSGGHSATFAESRKDWTIAKE